MDHKDRQILLKIYNHITSILEYCTDCDTLEEFQQNSMRIEACVFNLMQIGELAKTGLSDAAKIEISSIPWKQLYGMRNRIVHGYSGVDMRIVWDTIHDDLAFLKMEIKKYLN
ncbi:DUF86 domain-containing protein [uncultured Ruminococcus sp.]|uniref:HepT-like ribonuclease domain-containing protein n=1 Tax=uncultured Ruminococcus sp. TaxID=165186 RepID=UPI002617F568|nr:HepT-like ribonuclease domain-containing protein [uncultured Ruminococcus sp.]